MIAKSRYLPGTEAKGGGRDEQQEPFEERVFSFLCSGCCGAELSPKRNEPAWKFTIHRIYERYPLYSIFGIKCHVTLFTNLILRITWQSLNLILLLLLFCLFVFNFATDSTESLCWFTVSITFTVCTFKKCQSGQQESPLDGKDMCLQWQKMSSKSATENWLSQDLMKHAIYLFF